jgi:hypothetical protein
MDVDHYPASDRPEIDQRVVRPTAASAGEDEVLGAVGDVGLLIGRRVVAGGADGGAELAVAYECGGDSIVILRREDVPVVVHGAHFRRSRI